MSYPHKEFVQQDSRNIMSKNWVQISPTTWRRKTPEELEAENPKPIAPPVRKSFFQKIKQKLGGYEWNQNKHH